jgi:uncharacterized membrane protein YeaQ/YmgE (transglycosylase-associated protein family)
MGLVWTILIGFLAGVIAKFVHPGRENLGLVVTTLLGVGGSLTATFLGQAIGWYQAGQPAGFIGAVVGAVLLLFIYGQLKGKASA